MCIYIYIDDARMTFRDILETVQRCLPVSSLSIYIDIDIDRYDVVSIQRMIIHDAAYTHTADTGYVERLCVTMAFSLDIMMTDRRIYCEICERMLGTVSGFLRFF
jgi:hypothetical protein